MTEYEMMAPTAFRPMPHRPVSLPARRIRVLRQVDPDAGRGRVLQRDQATAPNHGADDYSLEATLPAIRTGWTGHLSSRPKAQGADPGSARPDPVRHTQKAERRIHALELPQAGRYTGRQQRRRPSRLERSWPEAAPSGTLHGQQRSGVRSQSGGHPRT